MFSQRSLQVESRRADTRGRISAELGGDSVEVWLWPADTLAFYGHGRKDLD